MLPPWGCRGFRGPPLEGVVPPRVLDQVTIRLLLVVLNRQPFQEVVVRFLQPLPVGPLEAPFLQTPQEEVGTSPGSWGRGQR